MTELSQLLRSMAPVLHPGVYAFVSVRDPQLLGSVDMLATVREPEGLSVVVREPDAQALGLPVLFRAAWITLMVHSELQAVGLTAAFAGALAAAGIACNVIAGARHDHVFVPVDRGQEALAVLRQLQRTAPPA
jgi:hypothetical protein